jgi:phospholipid-binding lipoprotein MlaA
MTRRASFFILSMSFAAVCCAAPIVAYPAEPTDVGLAGGSVTTAGQGESVIAETGPAPQTPAPSDDLGNVTEEEAAEEEAEEGKIADPLEPVNRFFFTVNDKLYFWVLKPAAKGYGKAVPEGFRIVFRNFYRNITAPVRIVNKLLQLKPKDAGTEFARLAINSTIGVGGLRDCAGDCFGVRSLDADFGQTLGYYGVGQGFYLVWPLLGPSSPRETLGYGFDRLLHPATWLVSTTVSAGTGVHNLVNNLSFRIGDYETLKKAAVDPYIAVRNAYVQNRTAFVVQAKNGGGAAEGKDEGRKQRGEINEGRP